MWKLRVRREQRLRLKKGRIMLKQERCTTSNEKEVDVAIKKEQVEAESASECCWECWECWGR